MKFFCDQCNAQYMIADEKVGPRGVKVKCKKCQHVIVVKPSEALAPALTATGDETRIHDGPALQAALAADRSKTSGESNVAAPSTSAAEDEAQASAESAANEASADAAAASKSSVKEWFVAVGDAQLGPLDKSEVHSRWDAGDLHEDSLAWRAGMPDWIALSEIPEFTDWVAQRPRSAPDKAEAVAKKGEGLGLAPASGVAWKPSAASALSSLMQEELLAAAAPKPAHAPEKPAGLPDLGNVAKLGASDLFSPTATASTVAAPASRDDMGGGGAAWSVPAPRKSAMSPAVWALIGGSVLSAVGLGVFVMRNKAPEAPMVAQAPAAAPAASATAPSAAGAPAQVMTSTPQPQSQGQLAAPAAPTAAPAGVTPSQAAPPTPGTSAPSAAPAPSAPPAHHVAAADAGAPAAAHATKKVHEPRAAHAAAAPAAAAPAAAVKASLGKEDIWGVVRQSASKVAPCIKNARSRNEIPAGKYTFVLDWTIRPDGAVVDAHLKGPPEVLSTSLAGCFSSAMMTWRFPASQAGAPIANFPFGPVNVP